MIKLKTTLVVLTLVLVSLAGLAHASPLSEAAASMAAGESMRFATKGYNDDLIRACGKSTFITDWARDAVWNSFTKEVQFVGQGHYACQKQIKYSEATNTWSEVGRKSLDEVDIGHGYEHNTIDPDTGTMYYAKYNSNTISKYTADGTWTKLPTLPGPKAITKAIEYFPEMDGLVVVDKKAGVWLFGENTNRWRKLSNPVPMGPYHIFAEYSPVDEVIIFGGGNGSTAVNKLEADGTVSRVADSPFQLGIDRGLVQPDTSDGGFIAFSKDDTQYGYDVPSNTWSLLGRENISITNSTISAIIPEYNVIFFATKNEGVTLYKLNAIPEPSTLTLFGFATAVLATRRRKRTRTSTRDIWLLARIRGSK